jgi:glycosyltransferase involved in cell wall biosynthesis
LLRTNCLHRAESQGSEEYSMAKPSPIDAGSRDASQGRAWVISSWQNGAATSGLLGVAGYSYDFLARLYLPLLQQLGEVIWISDPRSELEPAIQRLRDRQLEPVHLAFVPFQNATFTRSAPNVLVLAWEFPHIPDHEFDGNPQNDWPATAEQCALVIVATPFTKQALARGGVRAPVRVVPAPVADSYFQLESWRPGQRVFLDCRAQVFQHENSARPAVQNLVVPMAPSPAPARSSWKAAWKSKAKHACRKLARSVAPERIYRAALAAFRAARAELSVRSRAVPFESLPAPIPLDEPVQRVELSGIVYTCIINPDGRKNWEDLLTGFVLALRDCPDATLVIKLATKNPMPIYYVLSRCHSLGVPHRCKIVVISEYLTDAQMLELARASTYYLTTTRAEGICLPLMDFLAAGRPGVSPCHTALADYFGPDVGFVVESHPEPSPFPHDQRLRLSTVWQRLVWSSLVDQIRRSYAVVKESPEEYTALSCRARDTLQRWASAAAVQPLLESALATVSSSAPTVARAA